MIEYRTTAGQVSLAFWSEGDLPLLEKLLGCDLQMQDRRNNLWEGRLGDHPFYALSHARKCL